MRNALFAFAREPLSWGVMLKAMERVLYWGPLLFAGFFLFPLFVQVLARFGVSGTGVTVACALVAGALGVQAQVRGRWV